MNFIIIILLIYFYLILYCSISRNEVLNKIIILITFKENLIDQIN